MESDNTIVLVIVVFVLFAICLYLIERVEGFVGLRRRQFLRYPLAIVLVFLGYQGWQRLPMGYIPQFNPSESQSVIYSLPPISDGDCPTTHPVKGDFTTSSSGGCTYRVPGGYFYRRIKPDRCYATVGDAQQEGCKRSKFLLLRIH